jgi:Alginate lyase
MFTPLKWSALVVIPLLAATLPAAAQKSVPQNGNPTPPRVFILNAQELATLRSADVNDPRRQRLVSAVVAAADHAMSEGPFSVMDKPVTPPSGDKHDYMSRATYFWPDPSKPDGLPYIRHDGQTNPENRKITDHEEFGRTCEAARALALAWYFTGNADYANRAALLLRTWFLDPATKMNPNLEFAQAIMGVNTGRGIGIIDTRPLVDAVDAAGLLAGSTAWAAADDKGLHDWFTQYLHWMRTSKNGMDEDAAKNNHGNWYDVQVTSMELYLGDREEAIDTLGRVKTRRITVQIEPDGREPLELARTNAWGYSNFSLEALTELATLGDEVGVDLWNFKTADGRSIRAAVDFLEPYAAGEKKWDYQQIGGFHAGAMAPTLLRAAGAYHDPKYAALAQQIGSDRDDVETLLLRDALQVLH